MSRHAEKRGFDYCDETCPAVSKATSEFVDNEFDKFIERVKKVGSYKLRNALTQACEDLISAEKEVEELKAELASRDDVIADLREYVKELQREAA